MARKKKELGPILMEGDIVILYSQIGCEGDVLGVGTVERIKPMMGNPDENMVWVPGFAAHHPDAVERVGSPTELIGKIRVLERDLEKMQDESEKIKKELAHSKDKLDQVMKILDRVPAMLFKVDGMDLLDTRSIIKWIKEVRSKFALSAIRELDNRPVATKNESPRKENPEKDPENE